MNIVLLGCRGTGKSTIARILAKRLHRRLFSIDVMILKATGMTIPEIINKNGWFRFREIEAQQIKLVADKFNNAVIDCGGGVVLNQENIICLKEQGRAVWLTTDLKELLKRIGNDLNRPPLKDGLSLEDEQKQVLAEREPLYRQAADLICDTTKCPPGETASFIIRFFRDRSWI